MATSARKFAVRCVRFVIVCAFSCLLAAPVLGQQAPFIQITVPNAPKGAQWIFQDSRGGLWLAGCEGPADGLTYFDGNRFYSFFKDTFPKVVVRGIAEDSSGGIWLASTGGLHRVYQGKLQKMIDGTALAGIVEVAPDVFLTPMAKPNVTSSEPAELI